MKNIGAIVATNFEKSLEFTLRWEGGLNFDKDDPGGETKYGISHRAYPDVNIKDLSREQAATIYKNDYWDVMGCANRSGAMACVVFDTAVNCGIARTTLWLEESRTPEEMLAHRKAHYETLAKKKPLMAKFLKGWMNRLNALHKELEKFTPQPG